MTHKSSDEECPNLINLNNCSTIPPIVKTHGCQRFRRAVLASSLLLFCLPLEAAEPIAATADVTPETDIDDNESLVLRALAGAIPAVQDNQKKLAELTKKQEQAPSDKALAAQINQLNIANGELASHAPAAAKMFPESRRVQTAVAALAVQSGDFAKGREYADKAVSLAEIEKNSAGLADALRIRALGAYQAGDYSKATADAKRVLDMFPKDKDARVIYEFSKGRTGGGDSPVTSSQQSGNGGGTATAWPAGLPTPSAWNDPRVRMMGQRAADRQAAIRSLQEAIGHLKMGQAQAALDAATAAQRHDPSYADAYYQKAMAWTALNELAKALVEVTKAIGLWTVQGNTANLPGAYALRAQLGNKMSDYPTALSDADKSLAYDPSYARGYLERAHAREKIGKEIERAMDDYKRAAELSPNFRDEYEAAMDRLADATKPAPAPKSASGGLFGPLLVAAFALLAVLVGLVWKLTRRSRPDAVIGFAGDRKELDSQYDIVGTLGEGGMGAVYKGWDKVLKRPVAVKRLRAELQDNQSIRDRFLREAELVASLHHPHIVDIYTIIRDRENTYLVFEYVTGTTVHEVLNESPGRRLTPPRALEILRQIAEAVDHAHARHVIHRDLKPSNVMLADGGWVKVMDFGIARQVKDSLLTTTNTIVGTPVYMAPEQAMGAVVKESDVFSLGVTLYEMLTGALPFKGPNEMGDKMEGRFVAPSILVPDLGTQIDEVVKRPSIRAPRSGTTAAATSIRPPSAP